MGRGAKLSHEQQISILNFTKAKWSLRQISKEIGKSKTAVANFIKAKSRNPRIQKPPIRTKLSSTQRRAVIREAAKRNKTARQIQKAYTLPVGVRRVQQILQKVEYLEWRKTKSAPAMKPHHRVTRVNFARNCCKKDFGIWKELVFSDEKKFNFDVPDRLANYWHDLRKNERIFSKRQQGGDSLVVWAAISYYGTLGITVIQGNMDSKKYCDLLEDNLLLSAAETLGETWTFQQVGASVHRSAYTSEWLQKEGVDVLAWPAKSPDLNIIENIWGLMARRLYENGRQFTNKMELAEFIAKVWDNLSEEYLKDL